MRALTPTRRTFDDDCIEAVEYSRADKLPKPDLGLLYADLVSLNEDKRMGSDKKRQADSGERG